MIATVVEGLAVILSLQIIWGLLFIAFLGVIFWHAIDSWRRWK